MCKDKKPNKSTTSFNCHRAYHTVNDFFYWIFIKEEETEKKIRAHENETIQHNDYLVQYQHIESLRCNMHFKWNGHSLIGVCVPHKLFNCSIIATTEPCTLLTAHYSHELFIIFIISCVHCYYVGIAEQLRQSFIFLFFVLKWNENHGIENEIEFVFLLVLAWFGYAGERTFECIRWIAVVVWWAYEILFHFDFDCSSFI